jgi:HAMP domain-containing protein
VIFGLSYIETALLVLVAAVWVGIAAANSIAAPVSGLVQAAGRVSAGDLDARVDVEIGPEEIRALSIAFNMMTTDLQAQQAALRVASLDAESAPPVHRDGAVGRQRRRRRPGRRGPDHRAQPPGRRPAGPGRFRRGPAPGRGGPNWSP